MGLSGEFGGGLGFLRLIKCYHEKIKIGRAIKKDIVEILIDKSGGVELEKMRSEKLRGA